MFLSVDRCYSSVVVELFRSKEKKNYLNIASLSFGSINGLFTENVRNFGNGTIFLVLLAVGGIVQNEVCLKSQKLKS